jgi:hypothetical protein
MRKRTKEELEARQREFEKYHDTFKHVSPDNIFANDLQYRTGLPNDLLGSKARWVRDIYEGQPYDQTVEVRYVDKSEIHTSGISSKHYDMPLISDDYMGPWGNYQESKNIGDASPLSHHRLHTAVKEVSEHMGIQPPLTYVLWPDVFRWFGGGQEMAYAIPKYGAIAIAHDVEEMATDQQLKALVAHEIKHLYQAPPETVAEYHANELDADRAAVRVTDAETLKSINKMLDEVQEARWQLEGLLGKMKSWVSRTASSIDTGGIKKFTDIVRTHTARTHPAKDFRDTAADNYWRELESQKGNGGTERDL